MRGKVRAWVARFWLAGRLRGGQRSTWWGAFEGMTVFRLAECAKKVHHW